MKIFKNLNLLRRALMVLGFVLLLQPLQMRAALQNIEFTSLNNRDGLSNSQMNAILKDKTGYVWFGTQSGLNRFDGFRMKTFLYSATNQTSLANNYVDELQEDNEGKIWVHTSVGYCVYDPTTEQFDRKFLADVDKYIKDMMGDPDTSVESMSAHLCMSRVQLYKRMVSLTGTTPSEYLRAKCIKRAEELIHSDELNISEIAYTVGFNNPRYFSKYFQEAYGLTPSQYKKKLNGESI